MVLSVFFFQAEDGIRDLVRSRGLGDVYKRQLVARILAETTVPRLRLSSVEPWDLPDGALALWQDARLCRHLHLPLQSGAAATLRRMGRRYDPAGFAALVEAARRGVEVYVIYDTFANLVVAPSFKRFPPELKVLRYPVYTAGLRFWDLRRYGRDHRKILVVDRTVAFTGGMNIAEEYGSGLHAHSSLRARRGLWRDTHLSVEGPAAWELAVVFRESWLRADGPSFELPSLPEPEPEIGAGKRGRTADRKLLQAPGQPPLPVPPLAQGHEPVHPVVVLGDSTEHLVDEGRLLVGGGKHGHKHLGGRGRFLGCTGRD